MMLRTPREAALEAELTQVRRELQEYRHRAGAQNPCLDVRLGVEEVTQRDLSPTVDLLRVACISGEPSIDTAQYRVVGWSSAGHEKLIMSYFVPRCRFNYNREETANLLGIMHEQFVQRLAQEITV